ncbi:hypothetical protein C8Q76DRAFT_692631 [Earliella scabrosa]|nr:hypothetical protein C8Q76DRAFT_692631 [Earliella scabrosa]
MAIGKWIPFGQSPSSAAPAPVVVEQLPIVSAADAKLFGLENFGNTCYANSVLQALYFCGPFRELLLQYPDPSVPEVPPLPPAPPAPAPRSQPPPSTRKKPVRQNSISKEPSPLHPNAPPAIPIPSSPPTLLSALRSLFLHISRNPADKGTVAPRAFIDKLKELNELFRGSMHQDAHEFLNYLLNKIMEDMEDDGRKGNSTANGAGKSGEDLSTSIATLSTLPAASTSTAQAMEFHSTIVHRLFEGVLTSETRCLTCETVSSRDESFLDLSIDIEQNSSVTACLRQFSASEMLCQKNKFFCDSCCDLQEAEKRMKIKKLPNVLALHLKRFKYQEDVGKYIKLAYRVAFPLELRLFNTVDDAEDPDRLYELFAIVVHIGTGPHHGHYVTIIKARGAWMLFDDDTVSAIKESEIPKYFGDSNSGSAYVLYYQAVDLDLPALGLKSPTPPPESTAATDIGSTPGKPLSLATGEPSDNGHAPSSPVPHLPPGLVEEPDSSEKSDSPMAATPNLQPPKLASAPSQSLSVEIPTSGSQTAIPSSPSQPQHNHGFGGFFHTLRQTPSIRLRNGTSSAADRRSGTDAVVPPLPSSPSTTRRPRTAGSATSTMETASQAHDPIPSVPPSPNPSSNHAYPNGVSTPTKDKDKERHPEKKPSAWFRLKNTRGAGDTTALSPMSPIAPLPMPMPRLGRRGSEAAISDSSSPVPSPVVAATEPPPSPAQHKKSFPDMATTRSGSKREKRSSGQQSKLPPRPSTAGAAIGGGGGSSSSRSRPTSGLVGPPPLPPLPGSPMSPIPNGVEKSLPLPPPLPSKPLDQDKDKETAAEPSSGSRSDLPPPNPSTSTLSDPGATGSESERPRRESNPPRPSQSQSRPASGHYSPAFPPSRSSPLPAAPSPPHFTPSLSFGGSGGGGIGDTPVVSGGHGSGSGNGNGAANLKEGAANNWRRATRKLSFTAPMLGFGRREKERERERERREGPPSAFGR